MYRFKWRGNGVVQSSEINNCNQRPMRNGGKNLHRDRGVSKRGILRSGNIEPNISNKSSPRKFNDMAMLWFQRRNECKLHRDKAKRYITGKPTPHRFFLRLT